MSVSEFLLKAYPFLVNQVDVYISFVLCDNLQNPEADLILSALKGYQVSDSSGHFLPSSFYHPRSVYVNKTSSLPETHNPMF